MPVFPPPRTGRPRPALAAVPAVLAAAGLALAIAACDAAEDAPASGEAAVIDGNRLVVDGRTFRLSGSAAPVPGEECRAPAGPYPCGTVARAALMDLVAGATVTCTAVDDAPEAGGAGVLAVCESGGFDLARNMVHTGWALATRGPGGAVLAPGLDEVEADARAAGRGLWRGTFARPPGAGIDGPVLGADEICVRGSPVAGGVECPLFEGADGRFYSLTGGLPAGVAPGREVCLCGRLAEMSFCMQGLPLTVDRVLTPAECP